MSQGCLMLSFSGIEFQSIHSHYRDCALDVFLETIESATDAKEEIVLDKRIEGHKYSFGDFFDDFLYADWNCFHSNSFLKSISQNTFQRLIASQFFRPGKQLCSQKIFNHLKIRTGYCGLKGTSISANKPFVGTKEEFAEYKIDWYTRNPEFIDWSDDDFLPNRKFIEDLLVEELKKNGKGNLLKDLFRERDSRERLRQISQVFHSEIMNHLGRGVEREAYAMKIGGKICKGNYYIYCDDLSTQEKMKHKSLRRIYKIIKNGKAQYISLDFEKGMFEFHNAKGEHLGEFRYDGSRNGKARADHNSNFVDK